MHFSVYHATVLRRRFEIQDIIAQDCSGVTFLALDVHTGLPAAVQRFFPFGHAGGGLFDKQRRDYAAMVARLIGLEHPGLRTVLGGGCDPVDGMPFVASEWIEGHSLAEILQHGTFSVADAIHVLARVLEISECLSAVLGADAVWVVTAPELIINDAGPSRRGLTFELAPMIWLSGEASRRSWLPLAELAEELLEWCHKRAHYQAGQDLGAWLQWLLANADRLTLPQVRERLAGVADVVALDTLPGAVPPAAALPTLRDEWPQSLESPWCYVKLKNPFANKPRVWLAALVGLAGLGVWGGLVAAESWRQHRHPLAHGAGGSTLAGRVFGSGETKLIMQADSREVTVEGLLRKIEPGPDGIWYVDFQGSSLLGKEVRGYFKSGNQPDEPSVRALSALKDQRIRITGVVEINITPKEKSPLLLLKNRHAIQAVK